MKYLTLHSLDDVLELLADKEGEEEEEDEGENEEGLRFGMRREKRSGATRAIRGLICVFVCLSVSRQAGRRNRGGCF